jgi:flagellar protein FliO/FliZ
MRFLPVFFALMTAPAMAQEATPVVSPSSLFTGDYLLQVVGSFVVVILLLIGVLVLLRRFNGVSSQMNGSMRVISSVGVGQRERVVLLQVGEEQILVGVGPGNVRKIHAFDEPVVEPAASSTPNFSDVWKVAIGKSEAAS